MSSAHPMTKPPTVSALAAAVEREIRFVTEPIVDLRDGRVIAHEVLARPRNGMLFPQWMGSSSPALADQVWPLALRHAQSLLERGSTTHVNIGAAQLADAGLIAGLERALRPASRGRLVIEVTEHEPITASAQLESNLSDLRRMGVAIALDDFGEGYANMASLSVLTPEIVKVNRSLLDDGGQGPQLGEWLIATCRALRVRATVVERIETGSQRRWARDLGFDAGQGFLWR